jgi:hypothetical protein
MLPWAPDQRRRLRAVNNMSVSFAACSLRLEAAELEGVFIIRAAIAIEKNATEHIGPLIGDGAAVERIVADFLDRLHG